MLCSCVYTSVLYHREGGLCICLPAEYCLHRALWRLSCSAYPLPGTITTNSHIALREKGVGAQSAVLLTNCAAGLLPAVRVFMHGNVDDSSHMMK